VYAKTDEAAQACVSAVQAGAHKEPPLPPRQTALSNLLPHEVFKQGPRAGVTTAERFRALLIAYVAKDEDDPTRPTWAEVNAAQWAFLEEEGLADRVIRQRPALWPEIASPQA
jgi:hypothetical protein